MDQIGCPVFDFNVKSPYDNCLSAAILMLLNNIPLIVVSFSFGNSTPSVTLDIFGHYLPGMQEEVASLMDELVTPISTKLQQICISYETSQAENNIAPPTSGVKI